MEKNIYMQRDVSTRGIFVKSFLALTFMCLAFLGNMTWAQVSTNYNFSQSNGTYTPITGGTVLGTASGTTSALTFDSQIWTLPNGSIPFTFLFNGTAQSGLTVNSNGYITFGSTLPSASTGTAISSATAYDGAVAAWSRDLNAIFAGALVGEVRWEVVGTAPSREMVIQFKDWRPAFATSTTDVAFANFQIRLAETSNAIKVVYGAFGIAAGAPTSASTVQVGLRGATNADFNNRTNSTTVSFTASTAGQSNSASQSFSVVGGSAQGLPSNGLTYTWAIPSCFAPSALTASAITTVSATLNWVAPSAAPSNGYQYELRTSGAAGSGATGLVVSGATAAGILTANAAGLTPATTYTLYVRSSCGGTDFSSWSSSTFTTGCNPTNVPYLQDFEAVTTPALPTCTSIQNAGTGNNWITGNGALSGLTGQYLRYTYNANAANAWFYTQGVNLVAGTSYRISYNYAGSNSYPEKLKIAYGTSPIATSMTTVLNDHPNATNGPLYAEADFTPSISGVYYFGFNAYSIANQNYLLVDNIAVTLSPTCLKPLAVTTSAATQSGVTLSWTAPTPVPAGGYIYEVRTAGAAGSGATGFVQTGSTAAGVTTATISGLNASTPYSVYVRSYCAVGDSSVWTSASAFVTLCDAFNVPYIQDFESVTTPALPICTSVQNVGTGNLWLTANGASNGFTGKYLRYPYNGANAANTWFYTAGINMTAGTSYRITYNYGSGSYDEKLKVAYGTSPNAISMTNAIVDHGVITPQSVANFYSQDFTPAVSGVYYFGFNAYSDADELNLQVDNINITLTPSCFVPTAIVSSAVTTTTATISWTASTTLPTSGYEYEIRTSGAAGSGATGLTTSGTTAAGIVTKNITGLAPATNYSIYVRSNCGSGDFSAWTAVSTFTTLCAVESAPTILQDFANAGPAVIANCWLEATGALAPASTLTVGTSPWAGSTGFANTGTNKGVRINLYGTNTSWVISNQIDLGAVTDFRVKYDMAVTNFLGTVAQTTLGTHKVQMVISTDGGTTWSDANVLETLTGAGTYSNTGATRTVSLAAYTGIVRIAFVATTSSNTPDIDFHIDNFVVEAIPAPTVTSFTSSVTCGTSTAVTITGTDLSDAIVTINGTPITVTSNTGTSIVATISSSISGPIVVTTPGGAATSATNVTFASSPAFTLSGMNTTICNGTSSSAVTVATGGADYTTYTWTPATGVTGDAVAGWVFNPTITTNYVLNVSNVGGCSNAAMYTVNVLTYPNAVVVADASVDACIGATSVMAMANSTLTTTSPFTETASFGNNVALAGNQVLVLNAPITLPAGAIVTSTKIVFSGVTTTNLTYPTDITAEATIGATVIFVEDVIANVSGTVTNAGPYTLLATTNVPNAGGTVNLTVTNGYSGPATFTNISLVVEYTLPNQANITWWDAVTAGTQVGTGNSLETVGTTVMPTSTTPGTYNFYAESSNGICANATRQLVAVTINALPTPTITADGPLTFCAGDTVVLTSSSATGNVWSSAATSNSIAVTQAGAYTVTVTDANGCSATSAATTTVVNAAPATPTITASGSLSFCQGDSVVLTSSSATGNVWSSASTANSITANQAGAYTVTVTDANGCSSTSAPTSVIVNALPTVNAGTDQSICGPGSVTLTATGAATYNWTNSVTNGVAFNATATTTYTVTGTDANGCVNTDAVIVTVNTVPTAAATVDVLTLTATPAGQTYQWVNCATNAAIAGATSATFTATVNGSYKVVVTNATGCADTSACVMVNQVGLDEKNADLGISLYPNPTNGNVYVTMTSTEQANITVFDAQGKVVSVMSNIQTGAIIDLKNVENGMYMIQVASAKGSNIFRTVKN